eukprot:TRINITY_DN2322_c0_g1_i12.p1 TRINITY_DN2322_c0_g1~~TRINITY_DN2322_c0_g1_i12.p1  ORF type:complete len:466 (-),score=108.08 TRINITY_DN2322_c0_g1_i12:104-1501(-)
MNRILVYKISAFALTALYYASMHAARSSWSYCKKFISEDFEDIDKPIQSHIDLIFLLGYSVGNLFIAPFGDKMNLTIFLNLGLGGIVLFYGGIGLLGFLRIDNIWLFYALFGLNGIAQAVGWPGTVAVMSNWFGHKGRGLIMSTWSTNANIGNMIGTFFGSMVVDRIQIPWYWAIFTSASYCVVMIILLTLFLQPYPEKLGIEVVEEEEMRVESLLERDSESTIRGEDVGSTKEDGISIWQALKIEGVLTYTIVFSCVKASAYILLFWLAEYLQSRRHLGSASATISWSNELLQLAGSIMIGAWTDRMTSRSFPLPFCMVICAISFALVDNLSANYWLYILIPIGGTAFGIPYNLIGSAIAADIAKNKELVGNHRAASTVTALIEGVGALCAAGSMLIVGYFFDYFFYVISALNVVGAIVLIPLALREWNHQKNPSGVITKSAYERSFQTYSCNVLSSVCRMLFV